ncbi:MAG: RtcB family protein [Methanomicrobiales archaeon]|nr:RtcB family protein [Methanomicrobiales archaeon]MDD1654598.1 RtcB family protein [Methanomicrobiales archaeon]
MAGEVTRIGEYEWELPVDYRPGMRVPARFFLSEFLRKDLESGALEQLANVATLPGIVRYSLAMPDIHWGYGFPIGGVAAFAVDGGIISPGGVGFDINCGVRLLATPLRAADLSGRRELVERLFQAVPTGVGARSDRRLSGKDLEEVMVRGAAWAVEHGYGVPRDLERCEEGGAMAGADPSAVSPKARQRGLPQSGTLGSGNHFLEIQEVKEIYDPVAAAAMGVPPQGGVCVMIHCGSRGLGHQVCTDHLKTLEAATRRYGISLPDRQLACAPVNSPEGKAYYGAMAASANYAWANRQMITDMTRKVFVKMYGIGYDEMPLVYDVAHNVAKREDHLVNGKPVPLCVHRKGATRAFGPGSPGIPKECAAVGQPVIIPGSMGTPSFLLRGTAFAMEKTFGSTCHGAGRVTSRTQAKKNMRGQDVRDRLAKAGILVRAPSYESIAEEAPEVYKPSLEVVRVVDAVGLSKLVARLEPMGVIKG